MKLRDSHFSELRKGGHWQMHLLLFGWDISTFTGRVKGLKITGINGIRDGELKWSCTCPLYGQPVALDACAGDADASSGRCVFFSFPYFLPLIAPFSLHQVGRIPFALIMHLPAMKVTDLSDETNLSQCQMSLLAIKQFQWHLLNKVIQYAREKSRWFFFSSDRSLKITH